MSYIIADSVLSCKLARGERTLVAHGHNPYPVFLSRPVYKSESSGHRVTPNKKMEWNEAAKKPQENQQFRDKEAIFAPVMSPSWSRASQRRAKELEKEKAKTGEGSSLKDKLKSVFK